MSSKHRLDLRGIDLQSAAVDHVLLAIEYADEILRIDRAEIAGMPEAGRKTLGRCLRVVPVALDDRAAMKPDFADLAARQLAAVRMHDDDLGARTRQTDDVDV